MYNGRASRPESVEGGALDCWRGEGTGQDRNGDAVKTFKDNFHTKTLTCEGSRYLWFGDKQQKRRFEIMLRNDSSLINAADMFGRAKRAGGSRNSDSWPKLSFHKKPSV